MNLPGFVIIAAMKAATTSLHYYLNLHPQISMSKEKELNFFRNASQPGRSKGQFIKVLPVIILGLLMDGLGQFAGYVFGAGDTSKGFLCYEFHGNQHLAKKESKIAT